MSCVGATSREAAVEATDFNTNVNKLVEIDADKSLSCSQRDAFPILHRSECYIVTGRNPDALVGTKAVSGARLN